MFGGLGLAIFLSLDSGLGKFTIAVAIVWILLAIPITLRVQGFLVPTYLQLGWADRALKVAVDIREAAPNRKFKDIASLDVAMVHAACGRFDDTLRNLEGVNAFALGEATRALIFLNRAWARAWLEKDLDKAAEEVAEARKLAPDEGLIDYLDGLVRFKKGDAAGARPLVERSLEKEPDPGLPVPGERPMVLARILEALGEDASARWQEAKAQGKKGPFAETIAAA